MGGAEAGGEGEAMVRGLHATQLGVDEKLDKSRIQLFAGGRALQAEDMQADGEGEEDEEEEGSELEGDSGSGSDSELGSDEEEDESEYRWHDKGEPFAGTLKVRELSPELPVDATDGLDLGL